MKTISYQKSGILCIAILLGILCTGLWPFNFFPKNGVSWIPDRNGVQFSGTGIIASTDPWLRHKKYPFHDRSISLELWLRPRLETKNLPSIVTFYDGQRTALLTMGQWKSHLIIRSRVDDPATGKQSKSYQEIGFDNALLKNRDVFISLTSGREGSTLYLNGEHSHAYPHRRLLAETRSGSIRLILGNEATGHCGWTGFLLGLAIYDHVLTADQVSKNYQSWLRNDPQHQREAPVGLYDFSEKMGTIVHNRAGTDSPLTIPKIFRPVQKRVLDPPWRDLKWNPSFVSDLVVNIAGFVPLGIFFALFARQKMKISRPALYSLITMLGFGLSLTIELLQVYLPTRYSQLSDLLCNVTGTVLGLTILFCFERADPP